MTPEDNYHPFAVVDGNAFVFHDIARDPYPDPCSDCGRNYLKGERVEWSVPTLPSGNRLVWCGCIDCFLRRTDPNGENSRFARVEPKICPHGYEDHVICGLCEKEK